MDFDENELPQKQRLPLALKKYGRSVLEWRENCPVNGTRLFQQQKPLTEKAKNAYRNRREQGPRKTAKKREAGGEIQDDGSGGNTTKRRKMSSPSGGAPSMPSIVHSTTFISQGAFHMWSIDDPLAPTVLIDQKPHPAPVSPVPNPPSCPPVSDPAAAQMQCSANIHHVDDDTRPSSYTTPTTSSSKMEQAYTVDNAHFSPSHSTTLLQDTYNDSHSVGQASMQLAGQWSENPCVSATSSPAYNSSALSPALFAEQGDEQNTEEFTAVYKSAFIPRTPASRRPDNQALAPDSMNKHDVEKPRHTIHGSTPPPLVHSMIVESPGSLIGVIGCIGTGEAGLSDMSQSSNAASVAQSEYSEPIAWSAPPVAVAQIAHERSRVVNTANDFEYAFSHDTDNHNLPPAMLSSIHPRPPKLSSYSELAPASHFTIPGFADHHIPPPMDAPAVTFHIATPSTFPNTPLHLRRSAHVLGTYSQDPVYLTQPYATQDTAINEGGYDGTLDGGLNDRKPSSADVESPLLGEDFVAQQSPIAVTMDNTSTVIYDDARVVQESVTYGDRLLWKISSPLVSTGFAIDNTYHQVSTQISAKHLYPAASAIQRGDKLILAV